MIGFLIKGDISEHGNPYFKARLRGDDNLLIEQAHVSTWDLQIYDLRSDTSATPVYASMANATTILIPLTTGFGWDLDSIGGNFFVRVAKALYSPVAGRSYEFKWTFHCTAGSNYGDVVGRAIVGIRSVSG